MKIKITCKGNDSLPLDKITPLQGKLKSLSPENNKKLRDSILKHGFAFPVNIAVINGENYGIIDAHQRIKVVNEMVSEGYQVDNIPVTYTEAKNRKHAGELILQAVSQYGKIDDLDSFVIDFDIDNISDFDLPDFDIDAFMKEPGEEDTGTDTEPQTNKAEELQKEWKTETGQLWKLGEHRLICGDCTDMDVINRLTDGVKADLCFTSPPYAMQRKNTYGGIETDKYIEWWEKVQSAIKNIISDNGSFCVNIKPHCENGQRVLYVFDLVIAMVREWNWKYIDEFCWRNLANGVPGKFAPRLKNAFEPVYHFSLGTPVLNIENIKHDTKKIHNNLSDKEKSGRINSKTGSKFGMNRINMCLEKSLPSNVLELSSANDNTGHPAVFPIGLPSFFIQAYTQKEADTVIDPFLGSGTTMIACENLKRKCFGVEIDPGYCAVILQRYYDHIGIEPVL